MMLSSPPSFLQPAAVLPRQRRPATLLAVLAAHALLGGWLWQTTLRSAALEPAPRPPLTVWLMPLAQPAVAPEPPQRAVEAPPSRPLPRRAQAPAPAETVSPITLPAAVDVTPAPLADATPPTPAPELPAAAEPAPTPALAAPAPPPEPRVLPASAVRYLQPPAPSYPRLSLRQQESGTVTVRILVDERGQAREVRLEHSSGYPRLDQAAIAAAQQARFVPYTEQGVARQVWVLAPIRFDLDRSAS